MAAAAPAPAAFSALSWCCRRFRRVVCLLVSVYLIILIIVARRYDDHSGSRGLPFWNDDSSHYEHQQPYQLLLLKSSLSSSSLIVVPEKTTDLTTLKPTVIRSDATPMTKTTTHHEQTGDDLDSDQIDAERKKWKNVEVTIPIWQSCDYFSTRFLQSYSEWHQTRRSQLYFDYRLSSKQWNSNNTGNNNISIYNSKVMVVSSCSCCVGDNSRKSRSLTKSSTSVDVDACIDRLAEPLLVLPDLIMYAHRHNRVLFLNLTILPGVKLTEFLLPPINGFIDWRIPQWLEYNDASSSVIALRDILLDNNDSNSNRNFKTKEQNMTSAYVLNVMVSNPFTRSKPSQQTQSDDGRLSSRWDDESSTADCNHNFQQSTTSNATTFRDIWRALFTPTSHVQKNIQNTLKSYKGLNAPNHISVKLRRGRRTSDDKQPSQPPPLLLTTTRQLSAGQVVHCATSLFPKESLLLSITTADENTVAREYVRKNGLRNIYVFSNENNEKKREAGNKNDGRGRSQVPLDQLYTFFVDLYVTGALSRCVIFEGEWSVGHLSALISGDATCSVDLGRYEGCALIGDSTDSINVESKLSTLVSKNFIPKRSFWFERGMLEDGTDYSLPRRRDTSTRHQNLPKWLSKYFSWHKSTKEGLNESNWMSTQYLILACFAKSSCGGFSDRIKPLPAILLAAKRSKRLLLIYWERPGPLENWLIPPSVEGVDWRVPDWMVTMLKTEFVPKRAAISVTSFDKAEKILKGGTTLPVVFIQIQSPDGGESYYLEQPDSDSTYHYVFHEIFRRLFEPVPRVAWLIDSKMSSQNITKGEYAAVHLRAMYGNRQHRDHQETIDLAVLGINCANNLLPDSPIYFASDTQSAVIAATEYARMNSLPVTSLEFESNPLHLDKDLDWTRRQPTEYDATFVDLLMLANSRCIAYSNGGFGHFGSLLSHDSDCSLRFFASRHATAKCHWLTAKPDLHSVDLPTPHTADNETLLED